MTKWVLFLLFLPVIIAGALWEYTVQQFRAGREFAKYLDRIS